MDFARKIDSAKYTDGDLPLYPARTLASHVAMKGLELGSSIGLFLISPAWSIVRKKPFMRSWRIATPVGAMMGLAASMGLLMQKYEQGALTVDGVDDRAYRIMHNQSQKETDRRAIIGLAVGLSSIILFRGVGNAVAAGLTGISIGALSVPVEEAVKKNFPEINQR